jgi:hypothetical protein
MRSARLALCLVTALPAAALLAASSSAQPAQPGRPLTIAVFAPGAAFKGPYDLFAFGDGLAAFVGKETGLKVKSVAFAKPRQLEAAIRRGEVHFAVLDPLYLARRRHKVLAAATVDGKPQQRWALYLAAGNRSCSLRGLRLAVVKAAGQDLAFVERVLFGCALRPGRFFGAVKGLRDAGNAVSAVKLGRADCAPVPESTAWRLRRLHGLGWVVTPGFAQIDRGLPARVVTAVTAAVLRFRTAGALDGFKAADERPYRQLAARLASPGPRPPPVAPEPLQLGLGEVLKIDEVELALPPLDGYLGGAEEGRTP